MCVFLLDRMVLVVNGVLQEDIPVDSRSLYAAHPVYRETAAQLHSMPAKLVGPMGLLYVRQREMAATLPHDSKYQLFFSIPKYIFNSHILYMCIVLVYCHMCKSFFFLCLFMNIKDRHKFLFLWMKMIDINSHFISNFINRIYNIDNIRLIFPFFISVSENVSIIGSDDMTTCIIVVVRHSGKL